MSANTTVNAAKRKECGGNGICHHGRAQRGSSARGLLAPVRSKADGSARAHEKNQASTVGLKLAVNECEVRDKHTATRHSHDRK